MSAGTVDPTFGRVGTATSSPGMKKSEEVLEWPGGLEVNLWMWVFRFWGLLADAANEPLGSDSVTGKAAVEESHIPRDTIKVFDGG